jgi:hypothetical protein
LKYVQAKRIGGKPMMLFIFGDKRAQNARNREKAKALVDQYGDRVESHVREKIAATTWQIRDHAHWQRIEKHVKALLSR